MIAGDYSTTTVPSASTFTSTSGVLSEDDTLLTASLELTDETEELLCAAPSSVTTDAVPHALRRKRERPARIMERFMMNKRKEMKMAPHPRSDGKAGQEKDPEFS